ncbi:hypothetical protein B1C78_17190 [Thioalkalivibrio denitrificans]|uniref:Tetratricopeptide repeat protein n=1 Tax=Thioalkalivibrio denitrificans TaxID=108003 RepID=A0A1V3N6I5_9GAMM|nr:tetratricopeptide repeat protein [Thioalkalivibrio denitrificans]OOG20625.1 hypothetical protein B1C78_17190 [Thioalkalivibrio denitrificans]
MLRRLSLLAALAAILSACAPPQATRPAPDEPRTEERVEPVSPPAQDTRPVIARESEPEGTRTNGSDAVLALMGEADRQLVSGDPDAAATTLERALRIDARDARLWQRLAVVRLEQGEPQQAEAMAVRSNGLARGDREMMARNWRIIAEARRMAGNEAGAREADTRANALAGEAG